jgi:hypothetical protein
MYKALDVREVIEIGSGSVSNHPSYCGSNSMSIESTRKIVVIAVDEENNRKRFTFYDGHKEMFLGRMSYYGYAGDFDLLVPGDKFEVEETSTWPSVKLIKEN